MTAAAGGAAKRLKTAPAEEEEEAGEQRPLVEGKQAQAAEEPLVRAAPGDAAGAPAAAPGAPTAGDGLGEALATLQQELRALGSRGAAAADAAVLPPSALAALEAVLSAASAGTAGAADLLAQAGLSELADSDLLLVLREAVGLGSAYARCSLVAGGALLPRLAALDTPPSRALAAAVEHVGAWGSAWGMPCSAVRCCAVRRCVVRRGMPGFVSS